MAIHSDAYSMEFSHHDAVKPARFASSPRQTLQNQLIGCAR